MVLSHIEDAITKVKNENSTHRYLQRGVQELPNWQIRSLWAGHFSSNDELRNECRMLLRDLFKRGLDNHYHMRELRRLLWRGEVPLPEETFILAPVPVSGISPGCDAYSVFAQKGREPSDTVFIGYSPHRRTILEDGSPIKKEVCVNQEDLKILQRAVDEHKSLVFVDDIVDSGGTFNALILFAKKLGFKEIKFFDAIGKEYYDNKNRSNFPGTMPRPRFEPEIKTW